MSKDFNYFRIKMAYKGTNDLGAIVPIKSEDLVMATCYTEAEQIAYKLTEGKDEFGDVDVEIVRTKISEVAYNDTFATDTELICGLISYFFEESEDTEVGLYQVSLVYYDVDEKTGKTKSSNSTIYVPAYSSSEAIENIRTYLKRAGETREYTIRNVKYDKAQSVMVTPETHQNNIREPGKLSISNVQKSHSRNFLISFLELILMVAEFLMLHIISNLKTPTIN